MNGHAVVSHSDWLDARRKLLDKEKEFTRLRDELSEQRRSLPWERVDKDYEFTGADGAVSLPDLFGKRSQLMIYHFMFHPDWQEGCKSCSFWADNYNGILMHLAQRDVSFVTVSRAPIEKLIAFRDRMNWSFEWVSSLGSEFNFDYRVSFTAEQLDAGPVDYNYRKTRFPAPEAPGLSVFFRGTDGSIFHTYSCYGRGLDILNGTYNHLDLAPKGRDEGGLSYPMEWVRLKDRY